MMQCHQCEDWFHNHHLLPPLLRKSIGEEFLLICRGCAKALAAQRLVPYLSFMEPTCQKTFTALFALDPEDPRIEAETTSLKRLKSADPQPAIKTCRGDVLGGLAFDEQRPAIDIVIQAEFLQVVCRCEPCSAAFGKIIRLLEAMENREEDEIKLENNLDGEVNAEQEP